MPSSGRICLSSGHIKPRRPYRYDPGPILSALGSENPAKLYVYTELGVRRRSEAGCDRPWLALEVRAQDLVGISVERHSFGGHVNLFRQLFGNCSAVFA